MGARHDPGQIMADARNSNPPPRVRHIAGPLEGYRLGVIDVPVRVFDVTTDGCLVELSVGTLSGKNVRLQIDLPGEGWIVVNCETLHIAGHNAFAVKFTRLDAETRGHIERAIDCQLGRPPGADAPSSTEEANDD